MAKPDYQAHEVLHMSSFLMSSVDRELLEHDAIKNNREWQQLAEAAHTALFDLYQSIGRAHLSEDLSEQGNDESIPWRTSNFSYRLG